MTLPYLWLHCSTASTGMAAAHGRNASRPQLGGHQQTTQCTALESEGVSGLITQFALHLFGWGQRYLRRSRV
jgi:hypothetical protein